MSMKVCLLFLSMVAIGHSIKCINTTKPSDEKKDLKDYSVDCGDSVKTCHSYILVTPSTGNNTIYGCDATPSNACIEPNARRKRATDKECDLSDRYMMNVAANTLGAVKCLSDEDFDPENNAGEANKIYCYNGVAWDYQQFMGAGKYEKAAECKPKAGLVKFIKPDKVVLPEGRIYKSNDVSNPYMSQLPKIEVTTCTPDKIYELADSTKEVMLDSTDYKYDGSVLAENTPVCKKKDTVGELPTRTEAGAYSTSDSAVETADFITDPSDDKQYATAANIYVICEPPYKVATDGNTLAFSGGNYQYKGTAINGGEEPCVLDDAYAKLQKRTAAGTYSSSSDEINDAKIFIDYKDKSLRYSKEANIYVICEPPYKVATDGNTLALSGGNYQYKGTAINGGEATCEIDTDTYFELAPRTVDTGKYSISNTEVDTTGIFMNFEETKLYSKATTLYVYCEAPHKKKDAEKNEVKWNTGTKKYEITVGTEVNGKEAICEMDTDYVKLPTKPKNGKYSTMESEVKWEKPVMYKSETYSNAATLYVICDDGYKAMATGNKLTKSGNEYQYDKKTFTDSTEVCEEMKCEANSFPNFDVYVDGTVKDGDVLTAKAIDATKVSKGTTVYLKCMKSDLIKIVKKDTELRAYQCDPGADGKVSGKPYVECLTSEQYSCTKKDCTDKDNCNDAPRLQVAFTILLLMVTYLLW